jgi:antitoxin ParD1/3/4
MTITLPESMRNWIETQVALSGCANANEFVESILRAEQTRMRQEIDNRLLAGLASGDPIEVNEAFWAERDRVITERLAKRAKEVAQ